MSFYKTSLLSSLSTLVNVICGLIITKVTAQLIGPVGTAYIGSYGNILVLLNVFSTLSISTGLIKYTSEYKQDEQKLQQVTRTAFTLVCISSAVLSVLTIIFYKQISLFAFGDTQYAIIFLLLGLTLVLISFHHIFLAIVNGLGEVKLLSTITIVSAIINLGVTIYMVYNKHIIGALLSNITLPIISLIISAFYLQKLGKLNTSYFRLEIHKQTAFQLMKFGLFIAITSFSWMLILLYVRHFIEEKYDKAHAGLWQAMLSLSERYLNFITAILTIYFLPTLSAIQDAPTLIREMRKGFKRLVPLICVISFTIWLSKDLIIDILLAESFRPMRELFAGQMVGDVFKVIASIFGYLVYAKAMMRTGIKVELSYQLIFLVSTIILVNHFGLVGASYAFAFSTFVLLVMYSIVFRDLIVQMKKSVFPKKWV